MQARAAVTSLRSLATAAQKCGMRVRTRVTAVTPTGKTRRTISSFIIALTIICIVSIEARNTNKEQIMTDDHPSEIDTNYKTVPGVLPKRMPCEKLKDGMTADHMLGLFADDIDDKFFEALRWIRGRPRREGTNT
jgi:hypothetical protein